MRAADDAQGVGRAVRRMDWGGANLLRRRRGGGARPPRRSYRDRTTAADTRALDGAALRSHRRRRAARARRGTWRRSLRGAAARNRAHRVRVGWLAGGAGSRVALYEWASGGRRGVQFSPAGARDALHARAARSGIVAGGLRDAMSLLREIAHARTGD